jgi:hypothetical protein
MKPLLIAALIVSSGMLLVGLPHVHAVAPASGTIVGHVRRMGPSAYTGKESPNHARVQDVDLNADSGTLSRT